MFKLQTIPVCIDPSPPRFLQNLPRGGDITASSRLRHCPDPTTATTIIDLHYCRLESSSLLSHLLVPRLSIEQAAPSPPYTPTFPPLCPSALFLGLGTTKVEFSGLVAA